MNADSGVNPAFAFVVLPMLLAQVPASPTIPEMNDASPDILKLMVYDQCDRGNDIFGSYHAPSDNKVDWDAVSKRGSPQEFVRRCILRGFPDFLKSDVFGVGDGHAPCFQEQVG